MTDALLSVSNWYRILVLDNNHIGSLEVSTWKYESYEEVE